jgi:hypothetical protein
MATPVVQHSQGPDSISYLTQAQAASVDEALMGELGFSIDQLMVWAPVPDICLPTKTGSSVQQNIRGRRNKNQSA